MAFHLHFFFLFKKTGSGYVTVAVLELSEIRLFLPLKRSAGIKGVPPCPVHSHSFCPIRSLLDKYHSF